MVKPKKFEVYLVNLDPTVGAEIKKTRPAVIISPDSMNLSRLKTIIVAPMTSTIRDNFPTRITTYFRDRDGQIALDQLRAVDRLRLVEKWGTVDKKTQRALVNLLITMFQ